MIKYHGRRKAFQLIGNTRDCTRWRIMHSNAVRHIMNWIKQQRRETKAYCQKRTVANSCQHTQPKILYTYLFWNNRLICSSTCPKGVWTSLVFFIRTEFYGTRDSDFYSKVLIKSLSHPPDSKSCAFFFFRLSKTVGCVVLLLYAFRPNTSDFS